MLVEKGAALIRSFEAGARVGMRRQGWGDRRLQQLLSETAQQDDIQYLFITNQVGRIYVHNEPDQVSRAYTSNLDYQQILASTKIHWRRVTLTDGTNVFEVFKKFTPQRRMMGRYGMKRDRFFPPRIDHRIDQKKNLTRSFLLVLIFSLKRKPEEPIFSIQLSRV